MSIRTKGSYCRVRISKVAKTPGSFGASRATGWPEGTESDGFIDIGGTVHIGQGEKADIQIALGNQLLQFAHNSFFGFDNNIGIALVKDGISRSKHGDSPAGSKSYGQMAPKSGGQVVV